MKTIEMCKIPGTKIKMSKTLVTQELYKEVMGSNPSYFQSGSERFKRDRGTDFKPTDGENEGDLPVESVSWWDAVYFCNKLSGMCGLTPVYYIKGTNDITKWNYTPGQGKSCYGRISQRTSNNGYRLPMLSEWNLAAKGDFKYPGSNDVNEFAWYEKNSGNITHAVGMKKANDYGLFDLAGNVDEWLWDETHNPVKGDYISDDIIRSVRPGSFKDDKLSFHFEICEISFDIHWYGRENLGFRIVQLWT